MPRIVFIACLTVAFLRSAIGGEPPQTLGPYATELSAQDVEQITVVANPKHERLTKIDAFDRDNVHVHTGTNATYTLVTLSKHDGKWIVDSSVVTVY
jgi:hypothetical protein